VLRIWDHGTGGRPDQAGGSWPERIAVLPLLEERASGGSASAHHRIQAASLDGC